MTLDTPTIVHSNTRRLSAGTRVPLAVALVLSAVSAALATLWLLVPATNVYAHLEDTWLAPLTGPAVCAGIELGLGLTGVVAAIVALVRPRTRAFVVVAAAVQVAGYGIALQGMGTLALSGYLLAMAMPVVAAVILVQVLRRYPVLRWAVGVPVILVLAAVVILEHDAIGTLAVDLGTALAAQADRLGAILFKLVTGFAWAWTAVAALRTTPELAVVTAWVTRHRTVFTVVAACCALPYALFRLTWLTPWPMLGMCDIDMSTRIWGLMLSSGAWLAFVLTIGLLRPWSERFPRWVPGLAGRPVPVGFVAGFGGVVAAIMTFSAVPLLLIRPPQGPLTTLEMQLAFPCWIWGPALAIAVWGYVGHRRAGLAAEHATTGASAKMES
ncbi:hypothetical protein ACX9R5_10085 [Rathayibacter sp. CAU 1779]